VGLLVWAAVRGRVGRRQEQAAREADEAGVVMGFRNKMAGRDKESAANRKSKQAAEQSKGPWVRSKERDAAKQAKKERKQRRKNQKGKR